MITPEVLNVGLAVGRGTGSELADIFTKVLSDLGSRIDARVNINRSPRIYHSYQSLVSADHDFGYIHDETMQDAAHYEEFCRQQAAQGIKVIFRTAITAQPLYLVRQRLEAVKVEYFTSSSAEVLLVRDQAQGFYSGINKHAPDLSSVSRSSTFSRNVFERLVDYGLKRAHEHWGGEAKIENVLLVYKFHLFDGIFDAWARTWTCKHNVRVQFIQPDTMNRNILMDGFEKRQLIIASNEYADIMEVLFLNMFGQGSQENNYSQNVYLAPSLNYLTEYQTVHGSADDLTDKGLVNPSATMKVAAHILESHSGYQGLEDAMNRTIKTLVGQQKCTRDQGGTFGTSTFVNTVLEETVKLLDNRTNTPSLTKAPSTSSLATKEMQAIDTNLPTLGVKSALLVIDFQKDFASRINDSSPSLDTLTANITRLLSHIRKGQNSEPSSSTSSPTSWPKDIEIIHLRFLSDNPDAKVRRQMRIRNTDLPSQPEVGIPGTPGAELIIPPAESPFRFSPPNNENERVFVKSVYDPFLVPEFESHIRKRGIRHLILTGLYGDVCVDATARSGFQRNRWISIVGGCVGNLHLRMQDWETFARNVYGARKISVESFATKVVEQHGGKRGEYQEERTMSKL